LQTLGVVNGVAQAATSSVAPSPVVAGCPVFPADNVWNGRMNKLHVDPHPKDYVARIGADRPLHPDFGANPFSAISVTVIDAKVKYIKVAFDYGDQSDMGDCPIPRDALIEGGFNAAADTDHHIFLVD
jgi:hypothetical protein